MHTKALTMALALPLALTLLGCDESPSDDCLDATAVELRRLLDEREQGKLVLLSCAPTGDPQLDMVCGIRRANAKLYICGGDVSKCSTNELAEVDAQWELSMELLATCIEQR